MEPPLFYLTLFGLLIALTWVHFVRMGKRVAKERRRKFLRISAAVFSTLYTLFFLEVGCYVFVAQTDNFGATAASQRWFDRYWNPINSWGYRDYEHSPEALRGKKVLVVLGDSFTAAQGIESIDDRFSAEVGRRLGTDWRVLTLAQNGWNTPEETGALEASPVAPDRVLLAYYINDIRPAAETVGHVFSAPDRRPTGLIGALTGRSCLLDLIYWRVTASLPSGLGTSFSDYLTQCYSRDDVWKEHQRELLELRKEVRARGAKLVVVVFPNLAAVEQTSSMTAKVAALFAAQGVPCLDLGPRLKGRDPSELMVNPFDGHPSHALHAEVGRWIAEELLSSP